jgi:hypothetical protein
MEDFLKIEKIGEGKKEFDSQLRNMKNFISIIICNYLPADIPIQLYSQNLPMDLANWFDFYIYFSKLSFSIYLGLPSSLISNVFLPKILKHFPPVGTPISSFI